MPTKREDLTIDVYRDGDLGAPQPDSPEEILEYLPNVSTVIVDPAKARSYSVESLPYTVLDMPDIDVSALETSRYENELTILSSRIGVLSDQIADLLYVQENPDQFEGVDREKQSTLSQATDDLRFTQRTLEARALKCLDRVEADCFSPGANESSEVDLAILLPERKRIDPVLADAKSRCEGVSGSKTAKIVRSEKLKDHVVLVVWIPSSAWKLQFVGHDEGGPFRWQRVGPNLMKQKVDVTENCMMLRDADVADMSEKCYAFSDETRPETPVSVRRTGQPKERELPPGTKTREHRGESAQQQAARAQPREQVPARTGKSYA